MNNKISLILTIIISALVVQAQDTLPPDTNLESDTEVVAPKVPDLTEVPVSGAESKVESTVKVGSEPDYSKENEFHRIYKTYNEQPTAIDTWDKVVGSRESKNYKVQKGDTLSGISKTFFSDPSFWPKVWSLNHEQILNPHEIEPGLNVQFFPGSMDEAPSLELAAAENKKGETVVGEEEKSSPTKKETAEAEIPKPRKKYAPLLKKLPDSLPLYLVGVDQSAPLELQIPATQSFSSALQYLTYYINDAPIDGVGVVTGTELSLKTANEYQYIYVRLDSGRAEKSYVVQKNVGPISDPQQKGRVGHMVEVEGEIEILEPVNEQKNIFRAIVKKAIQPVEVGAIITSGKMAMINSSAGSLASGVGAKIIGGQYDRKRTLFSSDSLVFLDGGVSQGLQEGQSLGIFADGRIRNKNSNAIINDRMIGVVKIVRVTQNFATAYVVKASDDILLGDYVGAHMVQAASDEAVKPAASQEEPSASPNEKSTSPNSGTENSDLEL